MSIVSSGDWMILATGMTGSLGSQMPAGIIPLRSRLETSTDEKREEIEDLTRGQSGRLALIHCAAMTSVQECEADPERAFRLNLGGALSWFEAAEAARIQRFVFVSTAHVYEAPARPLAIDTQAALGPRNIYGKTKLQAEEALRRRSDASATSLSIARIFSLLSDSIRPGFLQHSLIQRAKAGDSSPLPGFDLTRDFIDAKEACAVLVRLAKSQSFPKFIQICSGKPMTVGELARQIFIAHGADPNLLKAAPPRPTDVPYLVGVPTSFI